VKGILPIQCQKEFNAKPPLSEDSAALSRLGPHDWPDTNR